MTGARVEAMIGAFDGQWARYSPGDILTLECLHWAFERGLDYDFRIGDAAHKFTWARRDTLTFDCRVGLSVRGFALVWGLHVQRGCRWLRFRIGAGRLLKIWRDRVAGQQGVSKAEG